MKTDEKRIVMGLVKHPRVFEGFGTLFHFSRNLFTMNSSCCPRKGNEHCLIQGGYFSNFLPFSLSSLHL